MQVIRFRTFVGVFIVLLSSATVRAQMPAYDEPSPVPAAITSARTVFLANAGADNGLFPEPFSGDEGRGYTEFYSALKATRAYTLAGDPSQADLVLELELLAPHGPIYNPDKSAGQADAMPNFKLVVYDRKSHYVLWAFTQSIGTALGQKSHDRNFDTALEMLLRQFLQLAGKTPAAAGQAPAAH